MREATTWRTYEEAAAAILNDLASEFSLDRVEPKQRVLGRRSGQSWEFDAKGVRIGEAGFVIVEIREYKASRLKAEAIAAIAYRILDTGANGGIVVSPLPLQEGAARVASREGIISVQLQLGPGRDSYLARFLNQIMVRMPHDAVSVGLQILGGSLETVDPDEAP